MNYYKLFQDKHALVDMDGVTTDFEHRFYTVGQQRLPKAFVKWNSDKYWIEDRFHGKYHKHLHDIICEKDFFLEMKPIEGAINAIHEMVDAGLIVQICSSPHPFSSHCEDEKRDWLRKYLGVEFAEQAIIEQDKTVQHGDILIDDKPDIRGERAIPRWTHVLFDAPYNKHIQTPHRLSKWEDWKNVLTLALETRKLSMGY